MQCRWPLLIPIAALGGCTTGYTFDYLREETSLVAPKIARYGLDPAQVQCVSERLASNLEVYQMRRLGDIAGLGVRPGAAPLPLNVRDLAYISTQLKDPEIPAETAKALAGCGLISDEADLASAPERGPEGDEIVDPDSIIAGSPAGPVQSASDRINGPKDYQPHADLIRALEAYEAGQRTEAVRLARVAAQAGDSGAQQFLAGLYSAGAGVKADPLTAASYYAMAAEQGWSEAMNNLGQAYETGSGVPRDPVEALKWYLLASARPTEDAEKVKFNLENVVAAMTPEQIQQAATRAREWEKAHGF
jgi:hypothetical protein